jgi:hypothetical protein
MTYPLPPADPDALLYGGKTIRRFGCLVSLTSMWHAVGRPPHAQPSAWLARPATRRSVLHHRILPPAPVDELIAHIALLPRVRRIDPDFLFVWTGKPRHGLWTHCQVALTYARDLDPAFHAWCNEILWEGLETVANTSGLAASPILQLFHAEVARLHERLDILDRHAGDVMFLATAAQELVLGNRRPFSERSQTVIRGVIARPPFLGRCPSCHTALVLTTDGKPARGAQYDHFFHRGLNRPEHGWLVCLPCHESFHRGSYLFRFSKLAAFRKFQACLFAYQQAQHRPIQP